MTFLRVIWDEENDLDGNVQHIAEHDLATDDFEYMAKKIERIVREGRISAEEKAKYDTIRSEIQREFPPIPSRRKPVETGIGAEIHRIRSEKGLTWYDLARQAGIADASIIRDIECGRDVRLANVEAVAKVLGCKLELVETG